MTAITVPDTLQMLADCFETEVGDLTPETPRDSLPGWDSMGALTLMAELDERFGLELTADQSRQMQKIGDVIVFLREHQCLAE